MDDRKFDTPPMAQVITQNGDNANSITINNFYETKVRGESGYLGIKLSGMKRALTETVMEPTARQSGAKFWSSLSASLSDLAVKVTSLFENTGKAFTISLNQAAKAGDTATLHASGLQVQAILGLGENIGCRCNRRVETATTPTAG